MTDIDTTGTTDASTKPRPTPSLLVVKFHYDEQDQHVISPATTTITSESDPAAPLDSQLASGPSVTGAAHLVHDFKRKYRRKDVPRSIFPFEDLCKQALINSIAKATGGSIKVESTKIHLRHYKTDADGSNKTEVYLLGLRDIILAENFDRNHYIRVEGELSYVTIPHISFHYIFDDCKAPTEGKQPTSEHAIISRKVSEVSIHSIDVEKDDFVGDMQALVASKLDDYLHLNSKQHAVELYWSNESAAVKEKIELADLKTAAAPNAESKLPDVQYIMIQAYRR